MKKKNIFIASLIAIILMPLFSMAQEEVIIIETFRNNAPERFNAPKTPSFTLLSKNKKYAIPASAFRTGASALLYFCRPRVNYSCGICAEFFCTCGICLCSSACGNSYPYSGSDPSSRSFTASVLSKLCGIYVPVCGDSYCISVRDSESC